MNGLVVGAAVLLALLVLGAPQGGRRVRRLASRPVGAGRRPSSVHHHGAGDEAVLPPGPGRGPAGQPVDAALLLDLVAAALDAGSAPLRALEVAGECLAASLPSADDGEVRRRCGLLRLGATWEEAWADAGAGLEPLRVPLALALEAGAPSAELLRAAAAELRRRRSRDAQRRAQALGVRLVLPLGACALPAFAAVAVVPVVVSLAQGVLTG